MAFSKDSQDIELRGERRAHFRGRSRPGRRVDLQYQRADRGLTKAGIARATAVTADIGVGGAFLLTKHPEDVGTTLTISLQVPNHRHDLVLEAEVRWASEETSTYNESVTRKAGMGIKFAPLSVDALLILQQYFSTLNEESG